MKNNIVKINKVTFQIREISFHPKSYEVEHVNLVLKTCKRGGSRTRKIVCFFRRRSCFFLRGLNDRNYSREFIEGIY